MKIKVHKIASVVSRLGFDKEIELTDDLEAHAGHTVVVRALREKRVYSQLELADGRMAKIFRGDLFVGALGRRRALRGFCGDVPATLAVGDTLQLLNRGGVLGVSSSDHMDFGVPVACEVLGMPVRDGRIVRLSDGSIEAAQTIADLDVPPILAVSGTGMDSGKTLFLAELIQELSKEGLAIAGGKVTGIACLRDLIAMEDHGAAATASFLDVGYASTASLAAAELVTIAKTLIASLSRGAPDLVALELGDGILGDYGVTDILQDEELKRFVQMHAFCAADLVGAWGGAQFLAQRGIGIDLFSGPCTDNRAGVDLLDRELGTPAINAYKRPEELARFVRSKLGI